MFFLRSSVFGLLTIFLFSCSKPSYNCVDIVTTQKGNAEPYTQVSEYQIDNPLCLVGYKESITWTFDSVCTITKVSTYCY